MEMKTIGTAVISALVTASFMSWVPSAQAQSAAAPNGVECSYASKPAKAEAWIAEQLNAGRTHILLGGTSAYVFCAY